MTHTLPFPKGVSVSFSGSAVLEMDFVINQNNCTGGLQLARRVLSVYEQIQSFIYAIIYDKKIIVIIIIIIWLGPVSNQN